MERTHIEKGGRSTTKESTRGNPWKKEKPRSTVEKMERLTGLNKLPAYMKRRKDGITGTPCRHEKHRHCVRWINQSVRKSTCFIQRYQTCLLAGAVDSCTSRPSPFRPGKTSVVFSIGICFAITGL